MATAPTDRMFQNPSQVSFPLSHSVRYVTQRELTNSRGVRERNQGSPVIPSAHVDVGVISTTSATTSPPPLFSLDPGSPPHLHPGVPFLTNSPSPSIHLGVSSHSWNTSPQFLAKEIGFKDVRPAGSGEAVTLAQPIGDSHLPGPQKKEPTGIRAALERASKD